MSSLRAQLDSARGRLAQLPEREFRMTQLSTEVKSLGTTYAMLNDKYQALRINEEAILSNARPISPADLPTSPISPQKGRNMMFGVFFGLILSVALAVLMDTMDSRVHSEEDAEKATRLPVLAYVPNIRDKARQSLLGNTDRATPLLESYRMLRTNVAFASLTEPIRSILVTSSQPNEGKSYSSLNLAIATALSGKKVILVDSDLRRPSLHRLLGLSNELGFTGIATGVCTLEEALQETQVPNLYFLSAGMRAPNPPELLDSEVGRRIFSQVMETADFAVVDSPPGLIMADAQVLATIVDAAIVVVSAADTNTNDIARICDQLAQTGVKMLGTILTKLPENFGGYQGYYYNYRYNYKYYSHYFGSDDKKSSNGHKPAALVVGQDKAGAADSNGPQPQP